MARAKWNKANVLLEALKYATRNEFKQGNMSAYNAMRRLKIQEEATSHMAVVHTEWTYELLHTEALKYRQRNHFKIGSYNAYATALRTDVLDTICEHMVLPQATFRTKTQWTDELLRDVCSKYTDRTLFRKSEHGAYVALSRRGDLDEFTAHMYVRSNRFESLKGYTKGIYFLYLGNEIVYIGKSKNLIARLGTHVKEADKVFNKISVYEIDSLLDIHVAEAYLIATHQPKYNDDMVEDGECELTFTIPSISDIIQNTYTYVCNTVGSWDLIKDNEYGK